MVNAEGGMRLQARWRSWSVNASFRSCFSDHVYVLSLMFPDDYIGTEFEQRPLVRRLRQNPPNLVTREEIKMLKREAVFNIPHSAFSE